MDPLQKLAMEIMKEHGDEFVLTKPLHEYGPGERPERKGGDIGGIYIFTQMDIDDYRVGNCWMEGRLHPGDVCMCVKHAGDCFNDYILLRLLTNAVQGIPESRFGAYVLSSEPLVWRPSSEEFTTLLKGEYISVEVTAHHPLAIEVGSE